MHYLRYENDVFSCQINASLLIKFYSKIILAKRVCAINGLPISILSTAHSSIRRTTKHHISIAMSRRPLDK